MENMAVFEFEAAVRGYHFYRQVWVPEPNEVLDCTHEVGNIFDSFAIKTISRGAVTCGHLPREISRATKFLLDRGARISASLIGNRYRRSPLFQGGLEIPCRVRVELPNTLRGKKLLERYREMVEKLYVEPDNSIFEGSFLENATPKTPIGRRDEKDKIDETKQLKNILSYFTPSPKVKEGPSSSKKKCTEVVCISID